MKFTPVADTDIGNVKATNQDSVLIRHATSDGKEVLLAVVCDGMGGLSKGELASATVIKAFSKWFDEELPYELENLNMQVIGSKWGLLLKELNVKLLEYSAQHNIEGIGTTFSGILFVDNQFVFAHVGDSRIYKIDTALKQLTTDHTFIAREISRGTMTPEQAKTDKRRNLLLQCIGASRVVEPEVVCGNTETGAYMLCSDGFRHEVSEAEIHQYFDPRVLTDKSVMKRYARHLIDTVKSRNERDNISVILIKAE